MIHRRIGAGVHSEVYHRPGSQVVLQVFRPECPELTVERLQDEYRYLRRVYASSLPALVPWQQLRQFGPRLQDCVLVKDYVPHRERPWLHHCDPDQLAEHSRHQLQQFVLVTRQLLAAVPDSHGDQVRFPDIIDDDLANLVLDTTGTLRLVDTNRLISARKLAALDGHPVPLDTHPIHAKLLRRLMLLDARARGRSRKDLARDPLYTRFLDANGMETVFAEAIALGEHLHPWRP